VVNIVVHEESADVIDVKHPQGFWMSYERKYFVESLESGIRYHTIPENADWLLPDIFQNFKRLKLWDDWETEMYVFHAPPGSYPRLCVKFTPRK
jgi:hypothetical protein